MNNINIELKIENTSKSVSRSIKSGNTYIIYVNEKFDFKDKNDLQDLANEINFQLGKDGIEPVEFRDIELDLMRLNIGGRGVVKIG